MQGYLIVRPVRIIIRVHYPDPEGGGGGVGRGGRQKIRGAGPPGPSPGYTDNDHFLLYQRTVINTFKFALTTGF